MRIPRAWAAAAVLGLGIAVLPGCACYPTGGDGCGGACVEDDGGSCGPGLFEILLAAIFGGDDGGGSGGHGRFMNKVTSGMRR